MEEKKYLRLVLKKKWYDMIASREKPEEYRKITPYWCNRLLGSYPLGEKNYWDGALKNARVFSKTRHIPLHDLFLRNIGFRKYDYVTFYMGYAKDRPQMTFKFDGLEIREGREKWGAEKGEEYFVIKLSEEE